MARSGEQDSQPRHRLDPAATWWTDEGSLVIHSELGPIRLPAGAAADLAESVIERLRGEPTLEELLAAFDPGLRADVASILDLLSRSGLATCDLPGRSPLAEPEERFYRLLGIDRASAEAQRADFALLVIGVSAWSAEAVGLLRRAGIGRIAIIGPAAACEPAGEAAAAQPRFATFEQYRESGLPDPQLILSGADRENFFLHYRTEALAAEIGVPALFATVSGFEAVAGPLFMPGASTCWTCARRRLAGTSLDPSAAAQLEERLRSGALSGAPQAQLPATAMMLAAVVAQEIDRFAAGYGHTALKDGLAILDLASPRTSLHSLLPMPGCERCAGIALDRRVVEVGSLPELAASTAGLVDERTGIISALSLRPVDDETEWPLCARALPSAWIEGGAAAMTESAGGKGTNAVAAHLGAIGESVERYAAARIDPARLRFCTAASLPGPSLEPSRLCLYEPGQYRRKAFPYRRYDSSTPIHWINGVSLQTGEPVWVPAQLVYFADRIDPAPPLCQATTNGLAAGQGFEDAAARAICELIERDAVMMTWLARLPARRIPLDRLQPSIAVDGVMRALGDAVRLELYLLDAGAGIPCVLSLLLGEDRAVWPAVTVASAAALTLDRAVRAAVLENAYSGRSIRDLARSAERRMPKRPGDIACFMDHALYYCDAQRLGAFDFLRSAPWLEGDLVSDVPPVGGLQSLRTQLADAGMEIVLIDLTSPDVASYGFSIVRALGAELQPLHCGHGLERRANPRLKALASRINPDPHPLC